MNRLVALKAHLVQNVCDGSVSSLLKSATYCIVLLDPTTAGNQLGAEATFCYSAQNPETLSQRTRLQKMFSADLGGNF